jgi:hypothetical protein
MHHVVTDFYSIPYQGLFALPIASTVATLISIAHLSHSSIIKYTRKIKLLKITNCIKKNGIPKARPKQQN